MTRIAIVSDIHGNLDALEAVIAALRADAPDLVVQGGDLALHGHQGAEVVDRIRELGWPGVFGNVDELLWRAELRDEQIAKAPKLEALLRVLFDDLAPATREALGQERIAWLMSLPAEWRNESVALVHAAPGDPWRAPMPDATEDDLRATYEALGTRVAIYGHIHRPYVRQARGLTVANSGSVGMPFDGDPRPSYLLVDDGAVTVRRVEYDLERHAASMEASGYPRAGWIASIRRSGTFAAPF